MITSSSDLIGKGISIPSADGGVWEAVYEVAKLEPERKELTGLAKLLHEIPLSNGTEKDVCLRLPGKSCYSVQGHLSYWAKRWGRKFRRQQTNQGVRIWRIR